MKETAYHKTEYGHKAKSHLKPTLPGHQMRNTGTSKVSWKSAILNCYEMLFHDVRPIEHTTEMLKKSPKGIPGYVNYDQT